MLPSSNSDTPTSMVVTPGHTPNVVNVTVFNPSSAVSAKNTPVLAMMQSPQLADHVPNGGVALKSNTSSLHNASEDAVNTGSGVALMKISDDSTSAKHEPSKTCVICNHPLPAMPGSMVNVSSSKHPSQSTSHCPEPSTGVSTNGSPPLQIGVSQSNSALTSLTAVTSKSSETTWT